MALARYSDRALGELLETAEPLGTGIGGRTALLEVDGTPVFVKRVPLTDLERRPENVRSTADLFGLPDFCHYGIGTPGFGAWREVAVHEMTTGWVLAGEYAGFPLTYHWRVLPDAGAAGLPDELADVERAVAFWGGGSGVRRRIEGLRDASASVALFLEYLPRNLHTWLGVQIAEGGAAADRACRMVERELAAGVSFMNTRELLHFDAHFENILTDGHRLFFADYGLALSPRFQLAPPEADFYHRHRAYDRDYTRTHLVLWLVTELFGYAGEDREAFIRAWAAGDRPRDVPEPTAAILTRHAPVAATMTTFYRALRLTTRGTPYPNSL